MDTFNEYLADYLDNDIPYHREIVQYLLGNRGKQLRAKLTLLCARLGGELNERSYRAAMIVEMLHTASLLHDDIVDNSIERRGAPSINEKWGEQIAVLSGDIISIKALLLSLSNKDYDIFGIYGAAVEEIVQGELLQLKKSVKLNTEEDAYFRIIEAKTAAFFSAGCKAGAVSTFTDEHSIEQLSLFGKYLGIAFQIKDDLFGFGDRDVGKPLDNDLQEKKLTLPVIHMLNTVSPKKQREMKRIIKRKKISSEAVDYIIQETKQNGGVEYATFSMQEYGQKAVAILDQFPDSEPHRELVKLVGFAIDRKF